MVVKQSRDIYMGHRNIEIKKLTRRDNYIVLVKRWVMWLATTGFTKNDKNDMPDPIPSLPIFCCNTHSFIHQVTAGIKVKDNRNT